MGTLKEYGDLFERLGLTELSVEEKDLKLTLKKEIKTIACENSVCTNEGKPQPGERSAFGNENKKSESDTGATASSGGAGAINGTEVKAPILGVFYENETPVKEGDMVEKGDVLCTIEAMKMMNEVKSPASGKVIGVSAENGALVEYHQTLFIIA